jgi:hypothetical protein
MKPKTLYIDDKIDPAFRDSVLRAEAALERVLGKGAARVEVRWEAAVDGGERAARLTIADTGVSKSYEFDGSEFRNDRRVREKLDDLWDGILAERIRIIQARIHQSLITSGEGD